MGGLPIAVQDDCNVSARLVHLCLSPVSQVDQSLREEPGHSGIGRHSFSSRDNARSSSPYHYEDSFNDFFRTYSGTGSRPQPRQQRDAGYRPAGGGAAGYNATRGQQSRRAGSSTAGGGGGGGGRTGAGYAAYGSSSFGGRPGNGAAAGPQATLGMQAAASGMSMIAMQEPGVMALMMMGRIISIMRSHAIQSSEHLLCNEAKATLRV